MTWKKKTFLEVASMYLVGTVLLVQQQQHNEVGEHGCYPVDSSFLPSVKSREVVTLER